METRTLKEARLAELKASLLTVEGSPTEVYSRIVGYYRSVRNWNAGKREEFAKRREYSFPTLATTVSQPERAPTAAASYVLFSRASCPNCPPVKEYLFSSGLSGLVVDVDTEEGLELARRHDVLSTPTALLMAAEGGELFRAHSRSQLETVVRPAVRIAPVAASV